MTSVVPFQAESTLTDRYQTTVPSEVRKALGLGKRDKICYTIKPDGQVIITRADQSEEDPSLKQFLSFLERDISNNPQQIRAVSLELVNRARSLVSDVDFDLDALSTDEDE